MIPGSVVKLGEHLFDHNKPILHIRAAVFISPELGGDQPVFVQLEKPPFPWKYLRVFDPRAQPLRIHFQTSIPNHILKNIYLISSM
ncbi:hypothetical protein OPQ81_000686 [Rhizoctonia solani]|nr:hypothetical protein OPQ81_000686 [Rhizoctonia solani]